MVGWVQSLFESKEAANVTRKVLGSRVEKRDAVAEGDVLVAVARHDGRDMVPGRGNCHVEGRAGLLEQRARHGCRALDRVSTRVFEVRAPCRAVEHRKRVHGRCCRALWGVQ